MKLAKVTGLPQLVKKLKLLYPTCGKGMERGLKKAGIHLLGKSQKEVPVDKGILRASGFVRKTNGSGMNAEIGVGYTAEYAIYVHENLDAVHGAEYNQKYADGSEKQRGPNQKAKFLEDPAREERGTMFSIIEAEVLKEMK